MTYDIAPKFCQRGFVPLLPQTPADFEEQGTQLRELGLLQAVIFMWH